MCPKHFPLIEVMNKDRSYDVHYIQVYPPHHSEFLLYIIPINYCTISRKRIFTTRNIYGRGIGGVFYSLINIYDPVSWIGIEIVA